VVPPIRLARRSRAPAGLRPTRGVRLCRILHTQKVEGVASKRDAARWVKDTYGDRVRSIVERAERWEVRQALDMKSDMLELLRLTLAETGGDSAV